MRSGPCTTITSRTSARSTPATSSRRAGRTSPDLDMAQWGTCVEDQTAETHQQAVAALNEGMSLGEKLGVTGTPGFFVNGRFVNGAQPLETFEALIEEAQRDS